MMQDDRSEAADKVRRWLWRELKIWALGAPLFFGSAWVAASWYHLMFDHFLPTIRGGHACAVEVEETSIIVTRNRE